MGKAMIPEGYTPVIDYMESQRAIKKIKDFFQQELAYGLQPVSYTHLDVYKRQA